MLPSSDENFVRAVERFEALGGDVAARRSAIIASHNWSPVADAGAADHHHAAAAKENGE